MAAPCHPVIQAANLLAGGHRMSHSPGQTSEPARLAANVRAIREARGLSQQQMAKLAGVLPVRLRGQVAVRKLLPETIAGLDLERMALPAGARMAGTPHTPGTREYLTCERGEVELSVAGASFRLAAGDVVVFRGDQRHGYHNPGRVEAIAYSVIAFAPVMQAP
jgi:quercetin dioxygenase-like cupin family protein